MQGAASDDFQVAEVGKVLEVRVVGLDVEEAGDFFEGAEDLQAVGVHCRVAFAECEVREEMLVAGE